jgi:hypothetical protein
LVAFGTAKVDLEALVLCGRKSREPAAVLAAGRELFGGVIDAGVDVSLVRGVGRRRGRVMRRSRDGRT